MNPIFDLYKNSPLKFNFHILGLPHTQTNETHLSCAYTQKLVKFMRMMSGQGHQIIHYGNEGSEVPSDVEHIQIFTEKERLKWFKPGAVDTSTGDLQWDANYPYWRAFGLRCASHLIHRAQKGDFILTVAGQHCYHWAVDQFPGCNKYGTDNVYFVDIGSGHYGDWTDFVVYESSEHREQLHGRRKSSWEAYGDAVIPNYFDLKDFRFGPNPDEPDPRIRAIQQKPYYLYMGRLIENKGWCVAVDTCKELGVQLVLAGQGDTGPLPPSVFPFGFANVEQRKSLMAGAIALLAPTRYREPFGGVVVEAQLSGTPAIASDQCGFCSNVPDEFRCMSHREYVAAARYAQTLSTEDRRAIQRAAQAKFSMEAVKPLYDRYFHRLYQLRTGGWYENHPWDQLVGL